MTVNLLTDLKRGGLEPPLRALVLVGVAVAPGDWKALAEVYGAGRDVGLPRADIEEALLQGVLFFGFPRIVTAFEVLQGEFAPAEGRSNSPGAEEPSRCPGVAKLRPDTPTPTPTPQPPPNPATAGRQLFARIYGKRDEAVRGMLMRFHPEFHDFVLEAAYGRILSRPQLDITTRELIAVANLGALQQTPQLLAHARGAVAVGATREQVSEAAWSGLRDEDRVRHLMARV